MATFTKVNDFVEHVAEGVHDLSSDILTIALSNTAPASEASNPTADGNGVLANVTEIASYANLSSRVLTVSASAQTGGTYKLTISDITLTASGSVPQFRYVYIFNDTPTTPVIDPLIAVYDYGSAVDMATSETFDIDFDDANGLLQLV